MLICRLCFLSCLDVEGKKVLLVVDLPKYTLGCLCSKPYGLVTLAKFCEKGSATIVSSLMMFEAQLTQKSHGHHG